MVSTEILIETQKFNLIFNDWEKQNLDTKLPRTTFIESLGLTYLRTRNGYSKFSVEDQHKFFLAKIQYGI